MSPSSATAETYQAQDGYTGAETVNSQILDDVIASTERKVALDMKQFEHKQRLARLFAQSGCFADIKKDLSEAQAIAQAFVKIELGESMGFTAAESMQGVHLINGTPAVNAQLRAARMQRAGFHWDIDWFDNKEGVCEGCRLWLYRHGKPLMKVVRDLAGNVVIENGQPKMEQVSVTFLKKDAEMLKTTIWENNQKRSASVLEKDNWKNSPRNMYFARAITNAQRFHASGVLSGEIPSTEEAMDFPEDYNDSHGRGSFEAQQAILAEKLAEAERWKSQQNTPRVDAGGQGGQTSGVQPPSTNDDGGSDKGETPAAHAGGANRETPAASGPGTKPAATKPVFGRPAK